MLGVGCVRKQRSDRGEKKVSEKFPRSGKEKKGKGFGRGKLGKNLETRVGRDGKVSRSVSS